MGERVSAVGAAISVWVARIRSLVGAISVFCPSISCRGKDVNVVGRAISVTVAWIRSFGPLISRAAAR